MRTSAALAAIESGTLTVELSASANQADDIPDNDRVSFDILVDAPEPETTVLESGFGIAPTMLEVGAGTPVSFSITNTGVVASLDTSVTLKLASGLQATALSSGCANAASGVICAVGELSPGSSRDFTITLSATDAGTYIYATEARASNANATRNSRAVSVNDVVATDVDMDTDMGADTNTNTDTDTGMGMGMGTDNGGHDGDSGIPVTGEESKESASSAGSGGPLILLVLLGLVGGRLRVRQSFA